MRVGVRNAEFEYVHDVGRGFLGSPYGPVGHPVARVELEVMFEDGDAIRPRMGYGFQGGKLDRDSERAIAKVLGCEIPVEAIPLEERTKEQQSEVERKAREEAAKYRTMNFQVAQERDEAIEQQQRLLEEWTDMRQRLRDAGLETSAA